MAETLFSGQTILLVNSLLVSLLLFGLWLSDRGQSHNLYWSTGLFALFIVVASLPEGATEQLSVLILISIVAGLVAILMLFQGTAIYDGRRVPTKWLGLALVAITATFFLVRVLGYRGAIVPIFALASVFWYIAFVLRKYGVVERIAAALFFLRGILVVTATLTSSLSLQDEFFNLDLIALSQIVAMASALSLLLVAFLANQRELERGRQLLRQGNSLAQRLGQHTDTPSVVRESIEILLRAEQLSTVWIYRLDEAHDRLLMLDSGGRLSHLSDKNPEMALEGSVSGDAVRSGRVQIIDHLASDARVNKTAKTLAEQFADELAGTNIVIPLLSGAKTYGTCSYHLGVSRKVSDAELEAYSAIGQTIGLALSSVGNLEEVTFRANHDSLTRLPNRAALHAAMRTHLASGSDEGATMFLLDLDKFKDVNDTLGHHVGDQLLKEIGPRLSQIDAPAELFAARLGGDEFVLLLMRTLEVSDALALGQRVLEAVRDRFVIDDLSLSIDVSIGVSVYPRDGANSHELLRSADVAMYQAKRTTAPIIAYSEEFDPHSRERLALMSDLKTALECDQLQLYYQPKIHLPSNRFVGVEALLRWEHPEHGMIPPGEFIPMAEVSPIINDISLWVIGRAIEMIDLWSAQELAVAVNVSMRNLADEGWCNNAIALIQSKCRNPQRLELELTESVFMHAPDDVARRLTALADTGVRIAIDDFGTGYSSLSYLRKLPINQLKIDQSFVFNLDSSTADQQIVTSIMSLASAMDLEVVAEGVENEAVLMHLQEMHCDYAQGYHIARPMPGDDLLQWGLEFASLDKVSGG